jgi:hypothetical protein
VPVKQLRQASAGRGSRLSSPGAHSSEAWKGAEASTVGVCQAELHKRALHWERATAYLAPSRARGSQESAEEALRDEIKTSLMTIDAALRAAATPNRDEATISIVGDSSKRTQVIG